MHDSTCGYVTVLGAPVTEKMLPIEQRLRNNRDFRLVYARGRSHVHPLAVLTVLRRTDESTKVLSGRRIGFVVSKKRGNAVVRNRIKRRMREAVRLCLPALREGPFDLVFVGRGGLREATWPELQAAIHELLRRAHLLHQPSSASPDETGGEADPSSAGP